MCTQCESESAAGIAAAEGLTAPPSTLGAAAAPPTNALRRKLWQIPPGFHCAVIGTCLNRDDIERMLRRAGYLRRPGSADFEIHGLLVTTSAEDNVLSRSIAKVLDRKYGAEVTRFARARTPEALRALWDEAMASGRIAGAFWALLTHGRAPAELCAHAHGEVHLLSHLMGGEVRRSMRDLAELKERCRALEEQLADARQHAAQMAQRKEARIGELEARLAARPAVPAPMPPAAAPAGRRTDERLQRYERRIAVERARARRAEAECDRLRRLLDSPPAGAPALPAPAPAAEPPEMPGGHSLSGKSVLYVGGKAAVIPHLRQAVERLSGRLIHHDGGSEHAPRVLDGLVNAADLVFCPIDCVSHDACLRLKRLCRREGKPFTLLRGSGATQFARALRTAASPAP